MVRFFVIMIYIIMSSMYVLKLLENNYIGLLNLDVAVHVFTHAVCLGSEYVYL